MNVWVLCECRKCYIDFKVEIPPDVENSLVGEQINLHSGFSESYGMTTCPNGHASPAEYSIHSGGTEDDVFPAGQWKA